MDPVATCRPCSSLHPSGRGHKHSCACSHAVCEGSCSVHVCDGHIWEVSQAQYFLTVEAGTSLSPQIQVWDFTFRSPGMPFIGRHPHCKLQRVRISTGLSLKHGLGIIK